jgi:mannosyltransferase OCH1-like enzyme
MQKQIPKVSKKTGITKPLRVRVKPVIPLHIYQVWHNKQDMPPSVHKSVERIKLQNPEFEHHLFDEQECRQFLVEHFPPKIVKTYDAIVPHAIKADLWRYCIMYKLGGIYLDSKYYGVHGFKLLYLTGKEYFCKDTEMSLGAIYNAILICKPGNAIMLQCIEQVVDNFEKNYYGTKASCIGPLMVARFFSLQERDNLELSHIFLSNTERYILYKDHRILKYSEDYYLDRKKSTIKHWVHFWKSRKLYKRK